MPKSIDKPTAELESQTLCKACGLCCTGHLFTFMFLDPAEVHALRDLGLGINQDSTNPTASYSNFPCLLWRGKCSIYQHRPHVCEQFKCKLLMEIESKKLTIKEALDVVQDTKQRIAELQEILPYKEDDNFRHRLIRSIVELDKTSGQSGPEVGSVLLKAGILLSVYSRRFRVIHLFI